MQRVGWWLIGLALTALLCLACVWAWVKLGDRPDVELTRWAAIANIVALPLAGLSLIAGVTALVLGGKEKDSTQGETLIGDVAINGDAAASNQSLKTQTVDRPETYIEVHSGAKFYDHRSTERPAPGGHADAEGPNQAYKFPHLQTPLALRVKRVTAFGESHEFEFYNSELADKWITSDPWRSQGADGVLNDE